MQRLLNVWVRLDQCQSSLCRLHDLVSFFDDGDCQFQVILFPGQRLEFPHRLAVEIDARIPSAGKQPPDQPADLLVTFVNMRSQILHKPLRSGIGVIRYVYGVVIFWMDIEQLHHWHHIGMMGVKLKVVQQCAIGGQRDAKPHRFDTVEWNAQRRDFSTDQMVEVLIGCAMM